MLIFLLTKGLKKHIELNSLGRFFQDFTFFQNLMKTLPEKQYQNMLKKLKYEFVPKHSVVFFKGTKKSLFYSQGSLEKNSTSFSEVE
jgi:hypothetical protein